MAWGAFTIALLLAYAVQAGVAAPLAIPHFDAFLIVALLCGLLAPTHDARIAAWIAGLVQDLGSADALGIHAFALGLTGLLVTNLRELANFNLWWVRGLALLLAAWPGQLIYRLHLHYWTGADTGSFWNLIASTTLTALLAAALVLLIHSVPGIVHRRRRRYRSART